MAVTGRKRKRPPTLTGRARLPPRPLSRPAVRLKGTPDATLYDFAPAMYVLLDASGLITDVNATGCRMLVTPRDQLLGLPLRLWIVDEHRRPFLDHLRRCRSSDHVVESEMGLRSANGGSVMARLYSRRMRHEGRNVFPTIAVDLTEHVALEQAKWAAELQRDQAQRERQLAQASEAAKDRLIAMVSHELRNPLSPILVAADVLASSREFPERVRQLGAVIKRNIEIEATLIGDLIDVARVTRGRLTLRPEPTDLHQVILDAVDSCAPAAQARGITITVDFQAERHHVQGEAARLRQVFWNLLSNAIKFSEPGGRVIVRTNSDSVKIIRVAIRDFGAGMDSNTLDGLFRPFEHRTEAGGRRGGLGLGLTISTAIVDGHGGRIWARSEGPGRGAMFELEFVTCEPPAEPRSSGVSGRSEAPIVPPATNEPARQPPRVESATPAGLTAPKILVVEDHYDTAALLAMFLASHGYDVTVAESVTAAINLLDREWTAILSDIGLADGSGLDIARRARALAHPPARMVALSGFGTAADVAASREAGFDEHHVKPVDLDKLLDALGGPRSDADGTRP